MRWVSCWRATLFFGLVAAPGHAQTPDLPLLAGEWGGPHIRLIASDAGARVEYDCATGSIDDPLRPDGEGRFESRGSYVEERGGPVLRGEPAPKPRPARYRGWTDGTDMRLQ